MITHEDIQELKKVFDDRYVLQSDCDETQREINRKFSNDDKRIDLMLTVQSQLRQETQKGFKFNNWLTTGVIIAIVGAVIAYYFMGWLINGKKRMYALQG